MPAAIGALVIIGVLITAGFFMAQQELRMGVASKHANMAVNIAQAGANEILANWNGYQLGNIAPWSTETITQSIAGGRWEVSITNQNNFTYFITSQGTVTNVGRYSGATRTIGIVSKMLFVDIDPPGALTTRGDVSVKGTALIDGTNYEPAEWGSLCDEFSDDDMPGVVHNGTGTIETIGQTADIVGTPPDVPDPAIVDDTFTDFGNLSWSELTLLASLEGKNLCASGCPVNVQPGPESLGGVCQEDVLTNWGDIDDPANPCGYYFPLIYHSGSLGVQSGMGQGLLLVEGDLTLQGNFIFYGIVIVQGQFSTYGTNNSVYGAVLASNGINVDQTIGGASEIFYSRCTVQRAILNNANLSRARPLQERSWVDLTGVVN